MNAITFFSLKGGTGKTTLCSSLGRLLAENGHSVLMIDLDPQGHLTQSLQGQPANKPNNIVSMPDPGAIPGGVDYPYFPPEAFFNSGHGGPSFLNTALMDQPWREWKLKDALSAMVPFPYDWVLIDVGASLNLITYNALFAAKTLDHTGITRCLFLPQSENPFYLFGKNKPGFSV